jgi:ADP-ribosylglycohydrolase
MTTRPKNHDARIERARRSLEGLSVGDAFGDQFFIRGFETRIEQRQTLRGPWHYTDDTEMGISVYEVLKEIGYVDQELLAMKFGERYTRDPRRGYGPKAHQILRAIAAGSHFKKISATVFEGQGSMGNGSAMRVGPVGAYFAEDETAIIAEQARLSAEVTHMHVEGIAGAVATALAAAWAVRHAPVRENRWHPEMLDFVIDHTPDSLTRAGLLHAREFQPTCSVIMAAAVLGSGSKVTCPDTVPFSLWCASHTMHDFSESMWRTVSGEGDRDTTCAIVGSITALSAPDETMPKEWLAAREPLPV